MLVTIYGPSKTGKTTFVTSGPDTYLLDLEDGAFAVEGATVRPVHSWQELVKGLEAAEKAKPKALAIDSLTVAYDYALQFVTKSSGGASLLAVRSNPTLQQFGQANELIKQLVLKLRALPFEVYCTAQERVQYLNASDADLGDDTVSKEAVIDLPNGARSFVVMYSDVLGYTHIAQKDDGSPRYRLWLQPTPGIVTGMRSHVQAKLPYLPNPTRARLHRYMGINK